MPAKQDGEDTPITTSSLIKWGGIVTAIVGGIISTVWLLAGQRQDTAINSKDIVDLKVRVVEVDTSSQRRHEQQQREIDNIKSRADQTDKNVSDMARKLDVVVAILERIEKSVSQQK